jgi:hypothetical protein
MIGAHPLDYLYRFHRLTTHDNGGIACPRLEARGSFEKSVQALPSHQMQCMPSTSWALANESPKRPVPPGRM